MNLQIFTQNGWEVRVFDRDGEPWFMAKDVALALGYKDTSYAIKAHCKGVWEIPTPTNGGTQIVKIIPERDMYRLIMRSKLPKAEEFEEWVVGEILPSIRKHGAYITPQKIEDILADPDTIIQLAQQLKFERQQKELAIAQRDEAISTKAEIGARREATAMATASAAVRKANALEDELGRGANWKATKAIPWVKDYFAVSRGLWIVLGKRLAALSVELGFEVRKTEHDQYGTVNTYHVDVIEKLRKRIEADNNMLGKYRK